MFREQIPVGPWTATQQFVLVNCLIAWASLADAQKSSCKVFEGPAWSGKFLGRGEVDFPFEKECRTDSPYSTSGMGCPTCFSPEKTIRIRLPQALDLGGFVQFRIVFKRLGPRRLLFNFTRPLNVLWAGAEDFVNTFNDSVNAFSNKFLVGRNSAFATGTGLLDSGPDFSSTGLEYVETTAILGTRLVRPSSEKYLVGLDVFVEYVMSGCQPGREGEGSISVAMYVHSMSLNTSSCVNAAEGLPPSLTEECAASCLQGYSSGPVVRCQKDGGYWQFEGCNSDCAAPSAFEAQGQPMGIRNAQNPTCVEGNNTVDGATCTPLCAPGFSGNVSSLRCINGFFDGSGTFSCHLQCDPPVVVGRGAHEIPCLELESAAGIYHLRSCSPRCASGFRPSLSQPLQCVDGTLTPSFFECHPLYQHAARVLASGSSKMVSLFRGHTEKHDKVDSYISRSSSALVAIGFSGELATGIGGAIVFYSLSITGVGLGQDWLVKIADFPSAVSDLAVLALSPGETTNSIALVVTDLAWQTAPDGQHSLPPSPVLQVSIGHQLTIDVVQEIPITSSTSLSFISAGSQTWLMVGAESSGDSDHMPSAVYSLNGTGFDLFQTLDVTALKMATFAFEGRVFIFACVVDRPPAIYSWVQDQGRFQRGPATGISIVTETVTWLGCSDDMAAKDKNAEPCRTMDISQCSDEAVKLSCGFRCGCSHDVPLLAVSSPIDGGTTTLRIIRLAIDQAGDPELIDASEVNVKGLVMNMCPLYVPVLDMFYLAVVRQKLSTIVYQVDVVKPSGEVSLRRVQELADFSHARSVTCAGISGLETSFVFVGTDSADDVDVAKLAPTRSARLYALEGNFEWETGDWSECSLPCRPTGPEVSTRNRTVSCKARPSANAYQDSYCQPPSPNEEEECFVSLCELTTYEWKAGSWGICSGQCGFGMQERSIECHELPGSTSGAALQSIRRNDDLCEISTRPRPTQSCKMSPCASYRMSNQAIIPKNWRVYELRFFADEKCVMEIYGDVFASGSCSACVCASVSHDGVWGQCNPSLAFDGFYPSFSEAGTAWISQCGEDLPCLPGEAWIGLHVYVPVVPRCITFFQVGAESHRVSEVSLESWNYATSSWGFIAKWWNVSGDKWQTFVVPRACSDVLDCWGHGTAQGLPGSCACLCRTNYRGSRCQYCSRGHEGYPACRTREGASNGWRLVATETVRRGTWHLDKVTFFSDVDCDEESAILFADMGEIAASADVQSAELVLDEVANVTPELRHVWADDCQEDDCQDKFPWIGFLLEANKTSVVKCVRVLQSDAEHTAVRVALDRWEQIDGSGNGQWERIRDWLRKEGARPPPHHVGGDEVKLALVCDKGLPIHPNIVHDCWDPAKLLQPWENCIAACAPGYSGNPQVLTCDDTFKFVGIHPDCAANECKDHVPRSTIMILAGGCEGLRTGQECNASCIAGLRGSPKFYKCGPDGVLVEKATGKTGQLPQCTQFTESNREEHSTSGFALTPSFLSIALASAATAAWPAWA